MKKYDVVIVGGGAVGCAIAYVLMQYDIRVALLEKNPDVAMGTSGKNSAVVHAGFNNKPGSLMAKLVVAGNKNFEDACKQLSVPYKRTGKLVVGFDEEDMAGIDSLIQNSQKNGCVGIEQIDRVQMTNLEANIGGIGAMYSSNTAVIDPFLYTIHLGEAAIQNGAELFMNSEVVAVHKEQDEFIVATSNEEYCCTFLINSAGLYSDKVAAMAGDTRYKIYPCRGQYLILDKHASELVSRPVYPVPHKGVGGLGVHLTTTIDGNILVGPSAEYIDSKEDYSTTSDVIQTLFHEAQQLLPLLERDMIIGQYTGIRSKLVAKGQANFGDFIIEESDKVNNLINLIGIESPGLTASLPIAEMVADRINSKRLLARNKAYTPQYDAPVRFRDLNCEEQDLLIASDPNYGEIVCRCEMVTKAEILEALHNPLGAHSIVSIKNRLRTTMGRCQGGYCLAKITRIMLDELGVEPQDIVFRQDGDMPFPGAVK